MPMPALTTKLRRRSIFTRVAAAEKELERRLSGNLEVVEQRLLDCLDEAKDPHVSEVVRHLVVAGGKRLRPALTLLGAEFGDPRADGVVEVAVISELVHTASLCHDDVMDRALMRHGVPSVNARWGNPVGVMAGNWLVAKAAQLSARLGPEVVPLQAEASSRLVSGQLKEMVGPGDSVDRLTHYFDVVSDKSASLIALSLRSGALQGGAPAGTEDVLRTYGEHLGVAFQISDDLLDITSRSSLSGKEQGKDLAIGVASLPVLLARADERPGTAELRALLDPSAELAGPAHERAMALLRESPAMAEAAEMMDRRLALARGALRGLPNTPALRVLDALCEFVATRRV
ncbi:polyprenyl synthetase family protein [Streptomyces sp. XM4193]|uniref:polyprenyl synthetase family protein n=1 Tax=Streptomyces sp. XM4193 TaxID=2929782 RepID=UPI0027E35871|nr:polyprenyl synthetase family protein [Streptomyces sp. XM4193]